jgi:hypothetical protein
MMRRLAAGEMWRRLRVWRKVLRIAVRAGGVLRLRRKRFEGGEWIIGSSVMSRFWGCRGEPTQEGKD